MAIPLRNSRDLRPIVGALAMTVAFAAVACSDSDNEGTTPPMTVDPPAGAIFALTNRHDNSQRLRAQGEGQLPATASGNEIVVFARSDDGSLARVGEYGVGGSGANIRNAFANPLAAQDPLVVSDDGRFLFAVSTASNTVTSFRIDADLTLTQADNVSARGNSELANPVSLAYRNNFLYVLNTGSFVDANGAELDFVPDELAPERNRRAAGIVGFRVGLDGLLTRIANSEVTVNTSTTGDGDLVANGGSIEFSPDGRTLYITERRTNNIVRIRLQSNGAPEFANDGSVVMSTVVSSTPQPYGTDVVTTPLGVDVVLVAQGNNGLPGLSALSSFLVANEGILNPQSQSAGIPGDPFVTGAIGGSWVRAGVVDGTVYAYVANTPDGTLTGYQVDEATGNLTRLAMPDGAGAIAPTGDVGGIGVLGSEIAGGYLYQVVSVGTPGDESNNPRIAVFKIESDGSLTRLENFDVTDELFVESQFAGIAGF